MMLLQIAEATEITQGVLAENIGTGIALIAFGVSAFLNYKLYINKEAVEKALAEHRNAMKDGYIGLLNDKDQIIAKKDSQIDEMRKEDREILKTQAELMAEVKMVLQNFRT